MRERVVSRCFREAARESGARAARRSGARRRRLGRGRAAALPDDVRGAARDRAAWTTAASRSTGRVSPWATTRSSARSKSCARRTPSSSPTEGRVAAQGDVVVVDLEGTPSDGRAVPARAHADRGRSRRNSPRRSTTHLVGVTAGAERDFAVDYAADDATPRAGRPLACATEVRVHEVKRARACRRSTTSSPRTSGEFARPRGAAARGCARTSRRASSREAERRVRQAILDEVLLEEPDRAARGSRRARRSAGVSRRSCAALIVRGVDPQKVEIDWEAAARSAGGARAQDGPRAPDPRRDRPKQEALERRRPRRSRSAFDARPKRMGETPQASCASALAQAWRTRSAARVRC